MDLGVRLSSHFWRRIKVSKRLSGWFLQNDDKRKAVLINNNNNEPFLYSAYHNIHIIPMRSGKEKNRKEDSNV